MLEPQHQAQRENVRDSFRRAWKSNAAVLAPFLLVAFLPRPWGLALAALVIALALASFFRSWRRYRYWMDNLVAAQRESANLYDRAADERAEKIRLAAALEEAIAEFDAARQEWTRVEAELRRRYSGKADERHLISALKEGLLATLGDQDAPNTPSLLRRRTARLRKAIVRYSRTAN